MQLIAYLKENRWKTIAATESSKNFREKNQKQSILIIVICKQLQGGWEENKLL